MQVHCLEIETELKKTQEKCGVSMARHQDVLLHLECTENELRKLKKKVGHVLKMLKESVEKYEALINELEGRFSF